MSRLESLEKRVAELEQRIQQLSRGGSAPDDKSNWIERISGSMADCPEFEEVVRLGREFRQSLTWENESETEHLRKKTTRSNVALRKT